MNEETKETSQENKQTMKNQPSISETSENQTIETSQIADKSTENQDSAENKETQQASENQESSESKDSTKKPEPKKITVNISQAELERIKLMQEDVDYVADSKEAILSRSTPVAKWLTTFLIAFLIVGLIWASLTSLDEVTRGVGRIIPASKVQLIQNLEGGILEKLYVKEGDQVRKGQIVAQLDQTTFASQYKEGYAKQLSLLATIARLEAEIHGKNNINFPPEVLADKHLVMRETKLFKSRIAFLQNTIKNLKYSYELANKELNITEPLVKKGVLSQIELLRLKRDVNSIKRQIHATQDDFYQKASTQYTNYKAESAILAEHLAALKDRMQRTTIRSPINGTVKQIHINSLGGVVKSGIPIMEIVPLQDNLIIETQIRPNKIAFIKTGQKATVRITAYDYAIYGSLPGVVTHVSADTSSDPNGNSYYQVDIKTDKNYLGSKEGIFPIKPGMTAMVDIITGKKSMLRYILKPILRAKEKAMRER